MEEELASADEEGLPPGSLISEEEEIPPEFPLPEAIAIPVGAFSADEAFAIMLLRWVPRFLNARIIRTDDPEVYSQAAVRLSLGPYNHETCTYQRAANLMIPGRPPAMSVAGLIYHHYGEEALAARFEACKIELPDDQRFMKAMVYTTLIDELDRAAQGDLRRLAAELDPVDDPDVWVKQNAFDQLLELIEEHFDQKWRWLMKKYLAARPIIRKAMQDRKKVLSSGEILVVPTYCMVEAHKDLIGGDEPKKHQVKYIVMPRLVGDYGVYTLKWRQNFRRLKHAGYRDENLNSYLQGMAGQTGWIHQNGTVGAWSSQQAAVDYLKQTLKQPEKLPSISS
jgi:uncharacterized UPF0160 family protein